jgi:hypothetical protein
MEKSNEQTSSAWLLAQHQANLEMKRWGKSFTDGPMTINWGGPSLKYQEDAPIGGVNIVDGAAEMDRPPPQDIFKQKVNGFALNVILMKNAIKDLAEKTNVSEDHIWRLIREKIKES